MFLRHQITVFAISCGVLFFVATHSRAEEPRVTAVLTNSETFLGRPVQLEIKVSGSPGAKPPDSIEVDGLDIRYSGQSQMVEARNLRFSYSFVYTFTIMPERTGTFKIPPQKILAGSNILRTPELTLHVADYPGQSARRPRENQAVDPSRIGFVELILTKSNAYLGEMIPAVVRVGFNTRTPLRGLAGLPSISGQGFTAQTLTEARETFETVKGRSYRVFSYKTAIAAARIGKIDIGPVEMHAEVSVPQMSRNPFGSRDLFDLNDPFFEQFFNDPAWAPTVRREITLKSEVVPLEVKPLPSNGPPEFSGAVGSFTVEAEAKPKSAQVGDPITVTGKISGRGNFDRVNAPNFADKRGWHQYPPASNFKKDDDVGISGTKTFETVLTPNEQKKNVPPFIFSFFDPVGEKFVTLQSDPIPVTIEGSAAPARPAIAAAPTPRPQSTPGDILYQITDWPAASGSFTPIYARPNFWLPQAIPLIALLGFVAWKWREIRLSNREMRQRASLQHEAAAIERKLRRSDASPEEYYAEAARAVRIKTALAKNVNPNTVDANTAAMAFQLDEARRNQLHTLFQRNDELRYSGGENGKGVIPAEQRREVLDLIEQLRA